MSKITELNPIKSPPVLKPFLKRCTMRGLKKCTECGQYNGTRLLNCKNTFCKLHQIKRMKKPVCLDTVQLISNSDSKLFSVQVREKDPDQRDFVQITDKTISSDDNGCIINRNAICYVDTCKYDSHDVNISCKHVKNSLENQQIADVLSINISVWYSLEINENTKTRLWNMYIDSEYTIPMIQRINKTTFVVKCDISTIFPAGLLHFQIFINGYSNLLHQQLPRYFCSCKKSLKSLSSNRIILENNRCDHFYLIIATILSNELLKNEFSNLLTLIPNLFESQTSTTESLDESLLVTEDFIKFSENILNDCVELCVRPDDEIILATPPETPVDQTFSLSGTDILSYQQYPSSSSSTSPPSTGNIELIHIKNDDNINENNLQNLESIKIVDNNTMTEDLQSLELIDCQIELMDQFKLTDHIDLCNDEIHLNETDIFGDHIICGLNSTSNDTNNFYINNDFLPSSDCSTDSLLANKNGSNDCYQLPSSLNTNVPITSIITTTTTTASPTTCTPEITTTTSAVHNTPSMEIIDPIKYRITNNKRKSTLFNYLEPVKKFDNNNLKNNIHNTCSIPIDRDDDDDNKIPSKILEFNIWLGSIIERINLTLDFNENGSPEKLIFTVYHDFFNNLLKRFSVGPKCRLPSSVKYIETGRFKGLILFTWTFYNLSLIKNIFSTDLIKLQPERTFKMVADGTYQPIIHGNPTKSEDKYCGKFKKIKPTKYSVCLKLQARNDLNNVNKNSCNNNNNNSSAKDVFVIEWIPNVLKQSKHGEMRISFKFVHMINNKII